MRTTVNLPEELLHEVESASGAKTRREAIIVALEDYLRRQRLQRVAGAAGTLEFDLTARGMRHRTRRRLRGARP